MAGGSRSQSLLLLLALVALTTTAGKAHVATFVVTNLCPFTVWPAAVPVSAGGGAQLEPRGRRSVALHGAGGTGGGRVWGRTGCRFGGGGGSGRGWCASGNCAGALRCQLYGKPPATLAEFTIGGAADYYDLSVVDGFNLPMDIRCDGDGEVQMVRCRNTQY